MEAVYYAARANLRRKLSPTSGLDAFPIGPGDGHVSQLDRVTGKNVSYRRPKTMSRCCAVSRGPLIILSLDSTNRWWIACWISGMIPPRIWVAPQVPGRSSTISVGMSRFPERGMRLPKSTRTIHRLLRENGRIASRLPRLTDPVERPKPMEHWQLDAQGRLHCPRRSAGASANTWWKPSI
jgi:hypothetical protein